MKKFAESVPCTGDCEKARAGECKRERERGLGVGSDREYKNSFECFKSRLNYILERIKTEANSVQVAYN